MARKRATRSCSCVKVHHYVGVEVQLHTFITLALDGRSGQFNVSLDEAVGGGGSKSWDVKYSGTNVPFVVTRKIMMK